MMRTRTFLLALLLITCISSAQATEPVGVRHGFLVFSSDGVANYTQEAKGKFRIIKEQVVYTYDLNNLGAAALRNVVHEERVIHEPVRLDFDDGERPDGMIIERRPPYRPDGPDKGTYIGILSRTTPAYAEAFEEKEDMGLSDRAIVRLKSHGRYDKQEIFRETREGPLWFKSEIGARYIESDMEEHVLRLQPVPYGKLKALPELRGVYFKALAY